MTAEGLAVTDDLGLPLDPKFYAKSNCKNCYGRGTYETSRQMTKEEAEKLMPSTYSVRQLELVMKKNRTSTSHVCGCAHPRYVAAQEFVRKQNAEEIEKLAASAMQESMVRSLFAEDQPSQGWTAPAPPLTVETLEEVRRTMLEGTSSMNMQGFSSANAVLEIGDNGLVKT